MIKGRAREEKKREERARGEKGGRRRFRFACHTRHHLGPSSARRGGERKKERREELEAEREGGSEKKKEFLLGRFVLPLDSFAGGKKKGQLTGTKLQCCFRSLLCVLLFFLTTKREIFFSERV